MNNTFNIDDLKSQWKLEENTSKYSKEELLKMLNRKTLNNVKYILIISIIEFCIGILVLLYLNFNENDITDLKQSIPNNFIKEVENFSKYYVVYNVVYFFVFLYFIYKFYYYYSKLRLDSSIKEYMLQIVDFRKWVTYFIYLNIILLILVIISIFSFSIFEAIKIIEHQSNKEINFKKAIFIGSIITIIIIFVFGVIIWLYYRIFYGIFLMRLKKNLKELKQLDV